MADTAVAITAGAGTNIDTRTESTNSNHRQVIVVGDPSSNTGVAAVKDASTPPVATDPALVVAISPNSPGLVATGTAGSPSATVLTVQGITSATPISTANTPTPTTTGGLSSVSTIITTANGVLLVKASAGSVKKIEISNIDSVGYWFKLVNLTTTPVAGTSAVFRRLWIPAGSIVLISYAFGLDFSTGIGYFFSSGIADNNTGAVTASVLVASIDYK